MKIRWTGGSHATQYGFFDTGFEFDTGEFHIPENVVKIWISQGICEEIEQEKEEKKEKKQRGEK